MAKLEIVEHENYDPTLAIDYDGLLADLFGYESYQHDRSVLERVYSDPGTTQFLGFLANRAVVMATLTGPNSSYGREGLSSKAVIENVATQHEFRGNGYGEQMLDFVIDYAKGRGTTQIALTSKPERAAAHRLYLKKGFRVVDDTTLFRLDLQ